MTELDLYLVRHGQTEQNGMINPGLSDTGHQQAELLADWVKKHLVCKAIFSSDMRRAYETALALDRHLPVPLCQENRLREYTGWDADGQPCNLAYPSDRHETWAYFCTRVRTCLREVAEAYNRQSVLWVAHGGIFDVMVATVLKLGTSHAATTFIHHTGMSHFAYKDGKLILVFHNRADHLPEALRTY